MRYATQIMIYIMIYSKSLYANVYSPFEITVLPWTRRLNTIV